MRALFINPGGLGDQILLLPTVKLLKENFPDCQVDLITEPRSTSIREITNLYRRINEFDFKNNSLNILQLRALINKQNYKYLFCTGKSYKANLVALLSNAEVKIGFRAGIFSKAFLTHAVQINTKQYAPNMFAELLSPIIPEVNGLIKEKDLVPEIKISTHAINWAKETLVPRIKEKYYAKKIFIHPGVSKLSIKKNILKSWSSKNWALLIENLLQNEENIVILIGGTDDEEIINNIHKNLTFFAKPKNFFDLSKLKLSTENLSALISLSDLFICSDSAPMHLAVSIGKKTVVFFGPTDPQKLLPNNPKYKAVFKSDLQCRPCLFDHRKESCSKPVCLDVTYDMILKEVDNQLAVKY